MQNSEQIDALCKALVAAEADMPSVPKTAVNPHFKSKYATLDAVVKAAQPVLAKHGLALVQGGRESSNGVVITTRVIHESGQWIESELEMQPQNVGPQGVGACLTYGSRYGYRMVGVVTDEDEDANVAHHQEGLTYDESAQRLEDFRERVGRIDNVYELKNWWNKHNQEIGELHEEHKTDITNMKDNKKADFETADAETERR